MLRARGAHWEARRKDPPWKTYARFVDIIEVGIDGLDLTKLRKDGFC